MNSESLSSQDVTHLVLPLTTSEKISHPCLCTNRYRRSDRTGLVFQTKLATVMAMEELDQRAEKGEKEHCGGEEVDGSITIPHS